MAGREGDPAFVSVAEAAAALGISERQARRDAGHLSDSDRRVSGKGPLRVRLAALAALRGQALPDSDGADTGPGVSDNDRRASANVRPRVRRVSGADRRESGALVDQLRAEVERLNAALERSQTLQHQTLAALTQEQERARELETANARLIAALPAVPVASEHAQQPGTETTPSGAPDTSGEAPEGRNGHEAMEAEKASPQDYSARNETPRRWSWWPWRRQG